MLYLVAEIIVVLLLAFVLGTFFGWILRGWGVSRLRHQLAKSNKERKAMHQELEKLRPGHALAEAQVSDLNQQLALLRRERESTGTAARDLQRENAELRKQIDGRDTQIRNLEHQIKATKTDATRRKEFFSKERAELAQIHSEELRRQEQTIAHLRDRLEDSQAQYKVEIEQLRDEARQHNRVSDFSDSKLLSATPHELRKPKTLLNEPRYGREPDDLKRISGVGPVLEKTLNELGIYYFDQLATFSREDVEWVDSNLEEFKGRIDRDNWVAQAAKLSRIKRNGENQTARA